MAAKPKLTPEQWSDVRKHWEGDPREGYAWLVDALSLPVSAPAVRKVAIRDAWAKPTMGTAKGKKPSEKASPVEDSMVSKVSLGNHAKVLETIEHESLAEDDMDGETEEQVRRSVGRPTLFRDDYVEQAYKLCLLGATDAELADFFDVSEDTIYEWKKVRHEFSEALRRGKAEADAEVAASLYKRAIGYSHPDTHVSNYQGIVTLTELTKYYPPETGAAFLWLKNRQPHKWRDKIEIKEDININVFPPKETLDGIFERVLAEAGQRDSIIEGRWDRLGLVIGLDGNDGD